MAGFAAFRAESRAEPVLLRIGGVSYELPAVLPASVALESVWLAHVVENVNAREDLSELERAVLLERELGVGFERHVFSTAWAIFGRPLLDELTSTLRLSAADVTEMVAMAFRLYSGAAGGLPEDAEGIEAHAFSVIDFWPAIEADFRREYRLDLATELERMSWRRFLVLLRGLSSLSATAAAYRVYVRTGNIDGDEEVIVLTTEEEVMAARTSMFGRPRGQA